MQGLALIIKKKIKDKYDKGEESSKESEASDLDNPYMEKLTFLCDEMLNCMEKKDSKKLAKCLFKSFMLMCNMKKMLKMDDMD